MEQDMNNERIVVVTNGNYFARVILEPLCIRFKYHITGVVLVEGDYSGHSGWRALWNVGRRTALPYTLYKVIQITLFRLAQKCYPSVWFDVERMCQALAIPIFRTTRVNHPTVYDWVREKEPALGISVSCPQRIRSRLLSVPMRGFLNIHSSLLPQYAGIAPYFWVLAESQKVTGVTVHYMTEEFDAGNILVQKTLFIPQGISAFELFCRLAWLGSDALVEATEKALRGDLGIPQDTSRRSYRSHPTWQAYQWLKRNGYAVARWSELWQAIRGTIQHQKELMSQNHEPSS